jgi:hypothetical protein
VDTVRNSKGGGQSSDDDDTWECESVDTVRNSKGGGQFSDDDDSDYDDKNASTNGKEQNDLDGEDRHINNKPPLIINGTVNSIFIQASRSSAPGNGTEESKVEVDEDDINGM